MAILLASISAWASLPASWRHFSFGVLAAYVLFALSVFLILFIENTRLKVDFFPSSGPSPELFLAVKNFRRTRHFFAKCIFVCRRNDPNSLWQGTFDLIWQGPSTSDVKIQKGSVESLRIARFEIDHASRLCTMSFWGLAGGTPREFESSRWNIYANESLPEYDIEIALYGEEIAKPQVVRFRVRPAKYTGPLEMIPLTVSSSQQT